MNTRDIRETSIGQTGFWAIAAPISFLVISCALYIAFRVPFLKWRQVRKGGQRDDRSDGKHSFDRGDDDLDRIY